MLRVGGIAALDADYDSVVKARVDECGPGRRIGEPGGAPDRVTFFIRRDQSNLAESALCRRFIRALVVVFQEGHGSKLFGLDGPTGSVYPIVPILSFAIVFGLSMDYEVFLVARVLEERRRGLCERSAVIEGLARTAGLITSAAAIMIAVFTALRWGAFWSYKCLALRLPWRCSLMRQWCG